MLLSQCPLDSGAGWMMGADFILLILEREPETFWDLEKQASSVLATQVMH